MEARSRVGAALRPGPEGDRGTSCATRGQAGTAWALEGPDQLLEDGQGEQERVGHSAAENEDTAAKGGQCDRAGGRGGEQGRLALNFRCIPRRPSTLRTWHLEFVCELCASCLECCHLIPHD